MVESLKSFIAKNKLIAPQQTVLLAVSGGIDSMVMTHLFQQIHQNIAVAHVNHGLRGQESDADEIFVKMYCKEHAIPFHSLKLDLSQIKVKGGNMHAISRDKRYAFFEGLCDAHGYYHIATAHHLDDNIETLFHRLCRGTGFKGMTGIPVSRGRIIRPLLFAGKKSILDCAKKHKIEYRTDASNAENAYDRNYLRNSILPLLTTRFPNLDKRITSSLENFNAEEALLESLIKEKKTKLIKNVEDGFVIEKEDLSQYLDAPFFLFKLLEDFGFSKSQGEDIREAIHDTSKQFLSPSHTLTIERTTLLIQENTNSVFSVVQIETYPCQVRIDRDTALEFTIAENNKINYATYLAVLDKHKLVGPVVIRPWKNGDSFKPFGMHGKKQKIKDFLVHVKHPSHSKKDCLVLLSKDSIAWVIPYRISEEFCVDENTTEVVLVSKKSLSN